MLLLLSVLIIIVIIIIITQRQIASADFANNFTETLDDIISACPILAKEQDTKRHDTVRAQLHFNICKETGVQLDKTLV